ncbi:hypothetical protein OG21DRAFT_177636 [Imleria badia]|nr:hypothetical protein OG21DRAFT_177636 [Imleria badia]
MDGCGPVVIITAVGYDYILTFPKEIDYIWRRPWTWVSTLFIIVRYVGPCWAIILSLIGTSLVPGPITVSTALYVVGDWGYVLFLAAADLMILRVYALWNRSSIILGILLLIYVPQIIISIVWEGIADGTLSVTIVQVLNSSYCNYSIGTTPSVTYRAIPRFVLGVALLILAFIPSLKQSIEMYKLSKRWQTSRSMKLLIKEGTVYFVVYVSVIQLCHLHVSIVPLLTDVYYVSKSHKIN